MKRNMTYKNRISILTMAGMLAVSAACTDDFAELNTNPKSLPEVPPEQMLYTAIVKNAGSGHYWNNWVYKTRWMQLGIQGDYNMAGDDNYKYGSNDIGNISYSEYNDVGAYVTNMEYLASQSATPGEYKHLLAAARIMLIAKAIQVSDLFGSLVYTDGWKARSGVSDEASLLPTFQTQEQLVAIWDGELKACIAALKDTAAKQTSFAGYDRAYNGKASQWVKAGNAIRLRLASRLLKRQPEVANNIANEVLAPSNAEYVMSGTDDSFIFWFDVLYTNIHGGDWHSSRDLFMASAAIMDYMNRNNDPRRRIYYRKNNLTPENIAAYNAQEAAAGRSDRIPTTWTLYEGGGASRAKYLDATEQKRKYRELGSGSDAIDMLAANYPQARLWKGNDVGGNGGNWHPVMAYSDFCFLSAEFVLTQGTQSTRTAGEWYEAGVRASLKQWSEIGKYCDIYDYSAITENEVSTFMANTDVAFSGDATKQLEQIRAQAWVDNYKNVDEAWAQWKRTNYPNKDADIVKFDVCYPYANSPVGVIPRRVKFTYPNDGAHNYANLKKRLDDMAMDPQFGAVDNEWGRLWWDKE